MTKNIEYKSKKLPVELLYDEQKAKLRGVIRFYNRDKNNILVQVLDNGQYKPCGAIYLNNDILKVDLHELIKNNSPFTVLFLSNFTPFLSINLPLSQSF